jgi:serine/threonine protein kinase
LFKAKKKIGKGAFATVYLAERLRDKKMVAVKAFSKEKQYAGDKGRESLENEVKLMRKLNHGNIMHLEGVYET